MILEGVRVVDRSWGIAGPYCTKVFADAGADVVKVESPAGDPLRSWGSGALFEFLNQSKRSVLGPARELDAAADVLVVCEPVVLDRLWELNPALVVVTVTPFGVDGPWAQRPATEFTLQAWAGSTGHRGLPEQPPLAAGGRIGEWLTGSYAAMGGLGALREARRSGVGEHVEIAMLDTMALTMATYPSVFASFSGWPPMEGTGRVVEVPSVEPTADGYAVFTTNSAQQYQDFVTMIGRSDLAPDTELASHPKRFANRVRFLEAVHEYTLKRTTEELLEEAGLWRIPSGPVLTGETIASFEQFVAREVYTPSPSGRFVQPRVPFRISGVAERISEPAPGVGEHEGACAWEPRAAPTTPGDRDGWRLPLAGLRVLDCTAWWAGPVAAHMLGCLGADVIKIESVRRPDPMRYGSTKPPTEDRWWEWGALFHSVNSGKRGITVDLTDPRGTEIFEQLLGTADVLIENYTPRVMEQFGLGWEHVHDINPAVVMVRMPAFGLDGPWRDRTGFAQTMECVSGMAWLTGFADGPPVLVRGACDPLAGVHAVIATLLGLAAREQSGVGHLVESVMVEAALNAAAEQVLEYGATGVVLQRAGNRGPVGAPQGVYPCAGDDQWLALAVTTDAEWKALRGVLGDPPWATDPAFTTTSGRRAGHDRIDAELAAWSASHDAAELAETLALAGVPAGVVIVPRDVVANPQLRHRGTFEVEDHPITGRHELPTLPFRYTHIERWLNRPSPVLGEHNEELLREIGLDDAHVQSLRAEQVIGERPMGL